MDPTKNKIVDANTAKATVQQWRNAGEKVVFTNGCFDILHLGHVDYLESARNLGSKLVLGLNSDQSVKRLKGEQRPLNDEYARQRVLAALQFVDLVVLFEEDTPLNLIKMLKPNILTKGADYSTNQIVGASAVIENGGEVKTIPLVEGYSTTNIVSKMKR